jgi:MoaF-like
MAMTSDVRPPDDFIAYPTNRVVGTLADDAHARAAIEHLLKLGFAQQDIDLLHSEEDLHRTDPNGGEGRFLSQFQKTVVKKLVGEYRHLRLGEEFDHLRRYIEDVRAGKSVIMVLAKKRDKRELAADILGAHGAELIEFYGRWSWQALESHPDAVPAALGEPVPGRTYEIDLGGTATHLCLESATSATILRKSTGSPDIAHLPVTELRPNLLMVAWQDADRTTTVHVYDFDSGEAHAVIGHGERRVRRARGTVRPAQTTTAPS